MNSNPANGIEAAARSGDLAILNGPGRGRLGGAVGSMRCSRYEALAGGKLGVHY